MFMSAIEVAYLNGHPELPRVVSFGDRTITQRSRRPFVIEEIIEEIVMKLDSKSGATLAAAAATLFLATATVSTTTYAADEGHCIGANACKGQSACKGGNHACKGLNACKGQGFAEMTKGDCKAAKGKFKAG
jgi:hypothetical protein